MLQPDKSFVIPTYYNRQRFRLTCERIEIGVAADLWQVRAKNKTLIFENNRPRMDRAKLLHTPWTWKLIKGELNDIALQNEIVKEMENHIRSKGKPPLYPV